LASAPEIDESAWNSPDARHATSDKPRLTDSTALTCADPLEAYPGRAHEQFVGAEPSRFDCVARAACESMAPAVVNTGL